MDVQPHSLLSFQGEAGEHVQIRRIFDATIETSKELNVHGLENLHLFLDLRLDGHEIRFKYTEPVEIGIDHEHTGKLRIKIEFRQKSKLRFI